MPEEQVAGNGTRTHTDGTDGHGLNRKGAKDAKKISRNLAPFASLR